MKDYIINSFIMTSNIDFVTIAGTKLVEGHIDTLNYEGINPHCELLKHHTSHLTPHWQNSHTTSQDEEGSL